MYSSSRFDPFTVSVVKDGEMVGDMPQRISPCAVKDFSVVKECSETVFPSA